MSDLPKKTFGRSGLEVTTLGFGAMELRGGPRGVEMADGDVEKLLNQVLDYGINFIDTALDYGLSQERIGRFISHRRDEYILASRCDCVLGGKDGQHVHTAENVRTTVETSLRQLNTDHLDLVQFHRSLTMDEFQADGALQELLKLQGEGKVRFIGVSGKVPFEGESGTLEHLTDQIDSSVFDTFQIPYSALQREHEDLIQVAAEHNAGTIIRGSIARGAPADWENRSYYMISSDVLKQRWVDAKLDEVLDGMQPIEFLLRFTMSHPGVSTTIVGTNNLDHLKSNVESARQGPLPEALLAEVKRRLHEAGAVVEAVGAP